MPDGSTCLHAAARFGRLNVVHLLVAAAGYKLLHATMANDTSCLHIACAGGHLDVVLAVARASGAMLVDWEDCWG